MPHDKWLQIKDIFNSALEYSGEERENYLAEACSSDKELRREVEILLHSYESDFMELPILAKVSEPDEKVFNQINIGDKI